MRFGICTCVENAKLINDIGYDYIELPLNKVGLLSEEEFKALKHTLDESGLKAETFCLLLPKTLSLFAENFKTEDLINYLALAFSRMQQLGGQIAVFGSGKSRQIPISLSYGQAFLTLIDLTRLIVKEAEKYKITIVIEPLNHGETNLINSVSEAAILASLTGAQLLSDAFHMRKENEDLEIITLVKSLTHVHIATKEGRRFPIEYNEEVASFFSALKTINYDQRMSIEGKTENFEEDARLALAVLKRACKEN